MTEWQKSLHSITQQCDTVPWLIMLTTAKKTTTNTDFFLFFFYNSVLTLSGGSRQMCEAEKASFLPTGQDLWIYLHLRSDTFTACEQDVFCSAACCKNTAIVLSFYILLFRLLKTDSAALDILFSLSIICHPLCLIARLTAGFAALHLAGIIHHFLLCTPASTKLSIHPHPVILLRPISQSGTVTAVQNYRLYSC